VAPGGAQSFTKTDLTGAFRDRYQHDVDNPNGAQTKDDQPNASQEPIHGAEDLAHGLLILDRVPLFPDVLAGGIKATMVAGHDSVQLILCGFVFFEAARLIVDERNRIPFFWVVSLQREELTHGVKRHKNSDVGGVLFFMPDLGRYADHF